MVVKKRFRTTFFLALLYGVAGTGIYFFLSEAQNGNRGAETNRVLQLQIDALSAELAALEVEKSVAIRRNNLLSLNSLDQDLLDERARALLNRVHPNDIVILETP